MNISTPSIHFGWFIYYWFILVCQTDLLNRAGMWCNKGIPKTNHSKSKKTRRAPAGENAPG